MKRILAVLVMFCIAVSLVGGSANADEKWSPSCNIGSDGKWANAYDFTINDYIDSISAMDVTIEWSQNCHNNQFVEAEGQWSNDGGAHWYDLDLTCCTGGMDYLAQTTSAQADTKVFKTRTARVSCYGGSLEYRTHVWVAGSDNKFGPISTSHSGC